MPNYSSTTFSDCGGFLLFCWARCYPAWEANTFRGSMLLPLPARQNSTRWADIGDCRPAVLSRFCVLKKFNGSVFLVPRSVYIKLKGVSIMQAPFIKLSFFLSTSSPYNTSYFLLMGICSTSILHPLLMNSRYINTNASSSVHSYYSSTQYLCVRDLCL